MNLNNLSAEEKQQLFAELQKEQLSEKERIVQERTAYKELKDECIREMFGELKHLSAYIAELKKTVFDRFETIISTKNDLFKTKSNRQTDTFTTEDGNVSITLGNRMYEGWEDEVEIGITMVKDYLKTLAKDENSANLVDAVMGLLAKDRKGNLKANKVLELSKLAEKSGNSEFIEGIEIIKGAYRPAPSCKFIEVEYKDVTGRKHNLPLSISAFDLD